MMTKDSAQSGPTAGGDIMYPSALPFVLVHLACFAAIWTGVTWTSLALCLALYWLRIFAIGAGYHRYFSHRSFSTSRAGQFVLAALSQSTAQKSVLWWASMHRRHHRHSDDEHDVHSPRHTGFLYSHVGWIFSCANDRADLRTVADLARYPELMWLHKYELVPAAVLAFACFAIGGWSGLIVGFFWSTVLVYHATFCINSLAHTCGKSPYLTGDDSRNNWLLALITMGEGWHNNHHAYQGSVRQGFRWWQIDCTFYLLKLLSWFGAVWDLKSPPAAVLRNEQRLGSRIIERLASRLADSFNPEAIARSLKASASGQIVAWLEQRSSLHMPSIDMLAGLAPPGLPSRRQILSRAQQMYANTPSIDAIVDRAGALILQAVDFRLAQLSSARPV